MKYDSGQPILIRDDLCGSSLIHKETFNNSLASANTPEIRSNKVDEITNVVDLDVLDNEALQDDGLRI